jgi:hypothetical protein
VSRAQYQTPVAVFTRTLLQNTAHCPGFGCGRSSIDVMMPEVGCIRG